MGRGRDPSLGGERELPATARKQLATCLTKGKKRGSKAKVDQLANGDKLLDELLKEGLSFEDTVKEWCQWAEAKLDILDVLTHPNVPFVLEYYYAVLLCIKSQILSSQSPTQVEDADDKIIQCAAQVIRTVTDRLQSSNEWNFFDNTGHVHAEDWLRLLASYLDVYNTGDGEGYEVANSVSYLIYLIVTDDTHDEGRTAFAEDNVVGLARLGKWLVGSKVSGASVNLFRIVKALLATGSSGDKPRLISRIIRAPDWTRESGKALSDLLAHFNGKRSTEPALELKLVNAASLDGERPKGFTLTKLRIDGKDELDNDKCKRRIKLDQVIVYVDAWNLHAQIFDSDGGDVDTMCRLSRMSAFSRKDKEFTFKLAAEDGGPSRTFTVAVKQADDFEELVQERLAQASTSAQLPDTGDDHASGHMPFITPARSPSVQTQPQRHQSPDEAEADRPAITPTGTPPPRTPPSQLSQQLLRLPLTPKTPPANSGLVTPGKAPADNPLSPVAEEQDPDIHYPVPSQQVPEVPRSKKPHKTFGSNSTRRQASTNTSHESEDSASELPEPKKQPKSSSVRPVGSSSRPAVSRPRKTMLPKEPTRTAAHVSKSNDKQRSSRSRQPAKPSLPTTPPTLSRRPKATRQEAHSAAESAKRQAIEAIDDARVKMLAPPKAATDEPLPWDEPLQAHDDFGATPGSRSSRNALPVSDRSPTSSFKRPLRALANSPGVDQDEEDLSLEENDTFGPKRGTLTQQATPSELPRGSRARLGGTAISLRPAAPHDSEPPTDHVLRGPRREPLIDITKQATRVQARTRTVQKPLPTFAPPLEDPTCEDTTLYENTFTFEQGPKPYSSTPLPSQAPRKHAYYTVEEHAVARTDGLSRFSSPAPLKRSAEVHAGRPLKRTRFDTPMESVEEQNIAMLLKSAVKVVQSLASSRLEAPNRLVLKTRRRLALSVQATASKWASETDRHAALLANARQSHRIWSDDQQHALQAVRAASKQRNDRVAKHVADAAKATSMPATLF